MFNKHKLILVALSMIIIFLGVSMAWVWVHAASISTSTVGWKQVNVSGFGNIQMINTLDTFKGQIYAGTYIAGGVAQIWRADNSWNWQQFSPLYGTDTQSIYDTQVFSNYLYIGTGSDSEVIAEIWRTDGSYWENVVQGGFGDVNNLGICTLMVYSNTIVAATGSLTGVEIWSSKTGDTGTWIQDNVDGFNLGINGNSIMDTYDGFLYFGSGRSDGAALLRTNDLKNWTTVFTAGLGNINNSIVTSMAEFNGEFYIGLRNLVNGAEVWRTTNGVDFSPVLTGGHGKLENKRPYALIVYKDHLYLVLSNFSTGAEVWRTSDGDTWEQVGFGGWGDSGNYYGGYFDKTGTIYNNSLFFGTYNPSGGQIWMLLDHLIFLPIIRR
jgi:hypothetical protein